MIGIRGVGGWKWWVWLVQVYLGWATEASPAPRPGSAPPETPAPRGFQAVSPFSAAPFLLSGNHSTTSCSHCRTSCSSCRMSCKRCQMSGIDCMTSGDHSWTSGCVCWTSGNRGRMSGSHCLMSVDDCRMSGDHRRASCNRCTTSCSDCRTSGRGRSTSVSHRNPSPKAWRATRGGCRRSVGDGSCPRRGSGSGTGQPLLRHPTQPRPC